MDTFTEDALVNDVSHEFWRHERIRVWVTREMVGDHVTLETVAVANNSGFYAVQCNFDGRLRQNQASRPTGYDQLLSRP